MGEPSSPREHVQLMSFVGATTFPFPRLNAAFAASPFTNVLSSSRPLAVDDSRLTFRSVRFTSLRGATILALAFAADALVLARVAILR
jgi:hypothetical protein